MVKLILLLSVLSGCRQLNKQAHAEVSEFMIRNAKLTCVSIEKNVSDTIYETHRLTVVCGKRK